MIKVWTGAIARDAYDMNYLVTDGESVEAVEKPRAAFWTEADLQTFLAAIGEPPYVPEVTSNE